MALKAKSANDSITEQTYLIMHKHINGFGRLFGGQLMQWIDELGGIVACRYTQTTVITAAVDNLQFRKPVFLNDILVLVGRVTYVGHSSMEVRVDSYVENLDGTRNLINRAFLIMVSIDESNKTKEIPPLLIENDVQEAEWQSGKKRSELSKLRRREGY